MLPPTSRRGVVLMDPSYEGHNDYGRVIAALRDAITRFAEGVYLVWYPQVGKLEAAQLPKRLEGVAPPTHVIRAQGVYIVPSSRGVIVGATMEEGRFDCTVEAAVTETLLSRARALAPELAGARLVAAQAGLRGASPDGLPMAGPTAVARLHAALAPRRNGWLLAPLVAGIVADGIEGRAPGVHAPVLDPGRFAD